MLLESTSINSTIGINDGSESKIGRQHVTTAMRRIGIDALSPSAHHQTRARPQDPSISAARHGDYATEPSLGDGNHLHSDGDWLRRSRCGVGLRSTSRSVVATVDHHELLRRTLAYSLARPGKPDIFNTAQALSSLDRLLPAWSPTTVLRSAWTERRMVRQRVCRTALEQRQTRGDVPAMTASAGRAARSAYISTSITVGVPIPVMAAARRIKPTLPAAIPYGSLTPRQRSHLSTRKQPRPALFHWTFQRGHSAHVAIPRSV